MVEVNEEREVLIVFLAWSKRDKVGVCITKYAGGKGREGRGRLVLRAEGSVLAFLYLSPLKHSVRGVGGGGRVTHMHTLLVCAGHGTHVRATNEGRAAAFCGSGPYSMSEN